MKMSLHEIHFSDWKPEPITAMAYCSHNNLLAIAREITSNIELYSYSKIANVTNNKNHPYFIGYIPGEWMNGGITAIHWVKSELIAITTSACLLHFDIWNKTVKARHPIVGIIGLSLAVYGSLIAVGSDSGVVSCFQLENNDAIIPSGPLPVVRGKILCLAWCPTKRQLLACGNDQGQIILFDVLHHLILHTLSLPTEGKQQQQQQRRTAQSKSAIVWDLKFLPSSWFNSVHSAVQSSSTTMSSSSPSPPHTLISAESTGHLSIWHVSSSLSTAYLQQRFLTHRADVLSLSVLYQSSDEAADKSSSSSSIPCISCWSSGVDPQLVQMKYVTKHNNDNNSISGQWILAEKRYKNNQDPGDVRVIVDMKNHLLLAGISGNLSRLSLANGSISSIKTNPVPKIASNCVVCPKFNNQFLVAMLEQSREHIGIYALANSATKSLKRKRKDDNKLQTKFGKMEHLLRIQPKRGERILSVALSPLGDYLAYSDSQRTRLLQFCFDNHTFQELRPVNCSNFNENKIDFNQTNNTNVTYFTANGDSDENNSVCASSTDDDDDEDNKNQHEDDEKDNWPPAGEILFISLQESTTVLPPASSSSSLAIVFVNALNGDVVIRNCRSEEDDYSLLDCVKAIHDDVVYPVNHVVVDSNHKHLALLTLDLIFLYSIEKKQIIKTFHPYPNMADHHMSYPLSCVFAKKQLFVLYPGNDLHAFPLNVPSKSPRSTAICWSKLSPISAIYKTGEDGKLLTWHGKTLGLLEWDKLKNHDDQRQRDQVEILPRSVVLPQNVLDLSRIGADSFLVVYRPEHHVECLLTKKYGL